MSSADLIRPEEVGFGTSPVSYNYTGFLDIVKSSFDNQVDVENVSSKDALIYDEYMAARDKYAQATGQLLFPEKTDQSYSDLWKSRIDNDIKQKRLEGDARFIDIPTSDEIIARAQEKAGKSRQAYNDSMMSKAPDTWGKTASFVGAAGGWFTDPFQAITSFYGGAGAAPLAAKLGRGLTATIAAEAAVNASLEAAYQPFVYEWKKQALDVNDGELLQESLDNVMFAGALGGGLAGLLHIATKGAAFRGLTSEDVRSIFRVQEQSHLNERPSGAHGAVGDEAHKLNTQSAIEDLNAGRIPDPAKFDVRSVPNKFDEDAVTSDHAQVASSFLESGSKKSELDAFIRKPFIENLKEELTIKSQLPVKDFEIAKKDLVEAKDALVKAKSEEKAAKIRLRDMESRPVSTDEQLVLLGEAEKDYKKAVGKKVKAIENFKASKNSLDQTVMARESVDDLDRIADGELPPKYEQRFKTYKKNVKEALSEERVPSVSDNPIVSRDQARQNIEALESPEFNKVLENDWKKTVKDSLTPEKGAPVKKYVFTDEDGRTFKGTASEIDDMLKDDENAAKAIKSCILGGA